MELFRKDGSAYRIGFLKDLPSLTFTCELVIREIFSQYQYDGKKIEAIKKVRTLLKIGLVEAKDLIEALDEYGVKILPSYTKFRPVEGFKKYRRINLGKPIQEKMECPVCNRDPFGLTDSVAVVTEKGERIGYFCRKCYDYLITMPAIKAGAEGY